MTRNTSKLLKERRVFSIDDFRGVDLSSSPFDISPCRASFMRNLIKENGVTRKRNGWIEKYSFGEHVVGMYLYEHGAHTALLVLTSDADGGGVYRIVSPFSADSTKEYLLEADTLYAQFFYNQGKCYILTGPEYLAYGTWDGGVSYEVRYVSDKNVYIPTTSILAGEFNNSSLDSVNLLTRWRKNKIEVDMQSEKGRINRWLDGVADIGGRVSGRLVFDDVDGYIDLTEDFELTITEADGSITECQSCYYYDGEDFQDIDYSINRNLGAVYFKQKSSTRHFDDNIIRGLLQIQEDGNTMLQIYSRVYDAVITYKAAGEDKSALISMCTVGCLFGTGGNNDRLFLSGNTSEKNVIRYSEYDDFSYFPDGNAIIVGSSQVRVKGFSRLTDGTLAVFKEKNHYESTIYYMTGSLQTTYTADNQISRVQAVFPVTAGSIGEGCASNYASCNFAGDSIILSESGVYGIVLSNNLTTNLRYAKERSYSIASEFKGKKLTNAIATVFDNRYYLCIDGVCYIADAGYKYYRENDADESYNYDWWIWDNVPATALCVMNGELWFGTQDGRICKFDNEYTDRTRVWLEYGEITFCENGIIIPENHYNALSETDTFCLVGGRDEYSGKREAVYAFICNGHTDANDAYKMYVDKEDIDCFFEGMKIKLEHFNYTLDRLYTVAEVDRADCTVKIADDGMEGFHDENFTIYRRADNIELRIKKSETADDETEPVLGLMFPEIDKPITLKTCNNLPKGQITKYKNVVARWTTPYFDMGTNMHGKTVHSFTFTGNGERDFFNVGYETCKSVGQVERSGGNRFDFECFRFDGLSFETGFAVSHTVRKRIRDFNYIRFEFFSDTPTPCLLHGMSCVYSVNKFNRGIK